MRRLRPLIVAALVSATTLSVPVTTGHAAVVRRLDPAVTNPMPAERLTASGVIGINGRPVVLQADLGRSRAWVVIGRSTSTPTGTFRVAYATPTRLGALRLRVVGTPARGLPVATPLRTVTVTRASAALTAPTSGAVSATVRMTVLTRPARRGRVVYVQRRRLGTAVWANAAAARREGAIATTAFAIPLGAVTGVFEYRALFASPTGPVASAGKRVSVATAVPAPADGPVRPVVPLQAAPGAGAPAVESLVGADADYVAMSHRWDPCRAISYRVNVGAVPAGIQAEGANAIAAAVATLSRDSGLQFTSLGPTTFAHPATQTFETPAGRPADAAMTIAFVAGDGAQAAEAGHAYVRSQSSTMTGPGEIYRADIVLFLGRLTNLAAPDTFDAPALRETILHELGHAVGLSHASSESVMAAIKYGDPFSEYQRGDRAGLLAVGSPRGCFVP